MGLKFENVHCQLKLQICFRVCTEQERMPWSLRQEYLTALCLDLTSLADSSKIGIELMVERKGASWRLPWRKRRTSGDCLHRCRRLSGMAKRTEFLFLLTGGHASLFHIFAIIVLQWHFHILCEAVLLLNHFWLDKINWGVTIVRCQEN